MSINKEFFCNNQEKLISFETSSASELNLSANQENSNEFFGPALPSYLLKNNKKEPGQKIKENGQKIYGPVIPQDFRILEKNFRDDLDIIDVQADKKVEKNVIIGPEIPEHLKSFQQNQIEVEKEGEGDISLMKNFVGPSVDLMSTDNLYSFKFIKSDNNKEKTNDLKKNRESWMLELPEKKTVIFDKSKRHFKMRPYKEQEDDRSVWTNTPTEKEKQKDKKKEKDYHKLLKKKKLEERDKEMKKLIEKATKKHSNLSLLEIHMKNLKKKKKEEKKHKKDKEEPKMRRPFDRNIDLQIHRVDENKKRSILSKASFLNDRFASGEITYSSKQAEINEHLELGRNYLSKGQLQDALTHYHAAVEGDANNYLTLYKRGTIFLALGKARQAIADLDRVLQLKPDFFTARLQRANIFLKQAKLDEALADYHQVLQYDPNNVEAFDNYHKIYPIMEDIRIAKSQPRDYYHHEVIQTLSRVIELCPWAAELREMRADRYVAIGNIEAAINDIKSTTKLDNDNTAGYFRLSMLYYNLGEPEDSLRQIRECLKLDPEHKDCFPHYKKVKKIDKLMNQMNSAALEKDYGNCIEYAKKILIAETSARAIIFRAKEKLCHCYLHNDQLSLAIATCKEALEIEKKPSVYCDRAEAFINSEMFDDAIQDYHKALEIDESYQRAKEGIQRAQRLQRQSERRDYYKILGVSRSASKKEIIKAYRKQAQKWHPDNFSDGDEKKKAEKKFIDIAAAKEVLTDPEKKQKYDNGEDPLDPESGQYSQGGFQFTQGFHHFHGSPFQFKFHFT